ncbi:unnamed protein product [Linum tenue]|uniref:Legume lectin domain-containing protein n=1 Tax=Linum tenue TaxID=586396 RepID=A0AAV0HTP9_9ROSI|nr:unnamed protein product [Linum tenue]
MYVGFSSSTSTVTSAQYILGWSFTKGEEEPPPLDLRLLPVSPRPSKPEEIRHRAEGLPRNPLHLSNRNLRRSLPSPIEAVQRAERRLGEGIQPAAALLQGSVPSDARIQGEGGPRIRRIRESVQRNPAQIKDRSRREENLSRFAARDEGIRRGDRQHGEAAPPESGTFARLLPAKGRAASGLRLHAQRQPGYLPVQRREADSRLDFTVPNRPKS